jgi:hypothetical protein
MSYGLNVVVVCVIAGTKSEFTLFAEERDGLTLYVLSLPNKYP